MAALPHVRLARLTIAMNILRFSDLCAQGRARGQRVFIRADLNVPLDGDGAITEDTRIRASVPCIQMALDAGAAVMVTSHLGRPTEGAFKPEDSLAPVAARLSSLLGRDVPLVADWVDGVPVQPGQVVLLENCRVNVGEKKTAKPWRASSQRCAIFLSTMPSVRPTVPRERLTASPSLHRLPAPARCSRPKSMPSPRHWPARNARWRPLWRAPRCPPNSPFSKACQRTWIS